jgi:hypothetical protein
MPSFSLPSDFSDFSSALALARSFDPQRVTDEVVALGESWAEQDAAASCLEETRKSVLAKVALEYLEGTLRPGLPGEKPKPMPVSQAELKALADPRYEAHLDSMVKARREANISRVRYDLGRMRIELVRSLQATLRNEMGMGKHLP